MLNLSKKLIIDILFSFIVSFSIEIELLLKCLAIVSVYGSNLMFLVLVLKSLFILDIESTDELSIYFTVFSVGFI